MKKAKLIRKWLINRYVSQFKEQKNHLVRNLRTSHQFKGSNKSSLRPILRKVAGEKLSIS